MQLDRRLAFVAENARDAKCIGEVTTELSKLSSKATGKLREFILSKIYAMRKPMSNLQMQQHALLKFSRAFEFLLSHNKAV